MKKIAILGSTGSIGTQTLALIRKLPGAFKVDALSCGTNINLFEKQIREFSPSLVSVATPELAGELQSRLSGFPLEIHHGQEGNCACASESEAQIVVAAMVGMNGLAPVLSAIDAGKDIALANKEVLVAGGSLVMPRIQKGGNLLLPVDSEHSAIWQCLWSQQERHVKELILTASGGPFRGYTKKQIRQVSLADTLAHPTWDMGAKITVDSAGMMNKGLEVIEASWLFSMPVRQISVVVHPQSIVHSMIRMTDGSVLAQLGEPDMALPIQVALFYPERGDAVCKQIDFWSADFPKLEFSSCDHGVFPALRLAYEAGEQGGTVPVVLNAANEAAVDLFLTEKIPFYRIVELVEAILEKHDKEGVEREPSLDDILAVDEWARTAVRTGL